MKTFRFTAALLAVTLTAFLGCSKTDLTSPKQGSISSRQSSNSEQVCGEPESHDLIDKSKVVQGNISVSNDATNVYVTINVTAADFKLLKAALIIGSEQHVKDGVTTGWPQLGPGPLNPDYSQTFPKPGVTSYTFTVPLSSLDNCFDIAVYGKLTKKDAYGKTISDVIFLKSDPQLIKKCWQTYQQYCEQECPPPPECKPLTTFTQGGYGNDQGNGTGTPYMLANFASAFPTGVTLGCAGGFTVKFTTATAIQFYLPTGTTASVLTASYTDPPDNVPDNVLIGQLLTLSLNVGFDLNDPNFGAGSQNLADMYIVSGTFAGLTVAQFLAIANDVLGGCRNDFTPSQVNDVADDINNNYDGGTKDDGFLSCTPPAQ
jgi:hypothetical protein